ncbi:outer membrane lipoprotein chaperone LolA [Nevskia ramosa]|uniref:outer membrane lipoprotein chaperone LolA n=1 Tax=Nevskia ramosa TaxID=64002 RepID=UPI0003B4013B|nr:outer membrane lipoprotein chaperone LolA [Nevskia ramosa]
MIRSLSSLLAVLLLSSTAVSAAGADSAQDALKRFVDGVQTFEAHFEQTQTDDRHKVTARSSGLFLLARPPASAKTGVGRFRWAYEKPYEQLSICDGVKLWAFDPDLNQVTVRNARDALAGTPAALLSQRGGLSEAFVVQDGGSEGASNGDWRIVRLLPKAKDGDFKLIELTLDKAGAPQRMRFEDPIGGSSEVKFSAIKTNQKIDDAQFKFVPPKGTEVVDGDSPPKAGAATP